MFLTLIVFGAVHAVDFVDFKRSWNAKQDRKGSVLAGLWQEIFSFFSIFQAPTEFHLAVRFTSSAFATFGAARRKRGGTACQV